MGGNERTVWAQEGSGFYSKSSGGSPVEGVKYGRVSLPQPELHSAVGFLRTFKGDQDTCEAS